MIYKSVDHEKMLSIFFFNNMEKICAKLAQVYFSLRNALVIERKNTPTRVAFDVISWSILSSTI